MTPQFVAFVFFVVCSFAIDAAPRPVLRKGEEFHGRSAWVIENGKIRVSLLRSGGHIAELRLLSDDPRLALNPMYVPAGSGYMGHIVCFPHFGPASPEERQQGLRGHGEAAWVEWRQTKPPQIDAERLTFFYGADLPHTQYRIERAVSLRSGEAVLHVEESIENLTPTASPGPGWFTLFNTDYPLIVGYLFPASEHAWIVDWQNQPKADSPAGTARGIEFGTSPFDEGLRRSVERGTMFGAPTYAWIGARQRLSTSFTMFIGEVPAGFAGVAQVRRDDARILITERGSGRELAIAHMRN